MLCEPRHVRDVLADEALVLRRHDDACPVHDDAGALPTVLELLHLVLQDIEKDVLVDGAAVAAVRAVIRRRDRDDELSRHLVDVGIHVDHAAGFLRLIVEPHFRRVQLRREVARVIADDLPVRVADDEVGDLARVLAAHREQRAQFLR